MKARLILEDGTVFTGKHIGADKDGAVVESLVGALAEGVARELAPLAKYIVAAAHLGLQPIVGHGALQHGELSLQVVQVVGDDKGEIEVA